MRWGLFLNYLKFDLVLVGVTSFEAIESSLVSCASYVSITSSWSISYSIYGVRSQDTMTGLCVDGLLLFATKFHLFSIICPVFDIS